jgi:hypothetical protein
MTIINASNSCVFQDEDDDQWYYYTECYDVNGPYHSRETAEKSATRYGKWLNDGKIPWFPELIVVPKFIFCWYDFWVGFYWDHKEWALYFFPVPTLGVKINVDWIY